MKIRYQPRHGTQEVEIRDIMGGHELATWRAGDEREVGGVTVTFRQPSGKPVQMDAATALFSCGPDFVDANTGKNPQFVCTRCGEETLADYFTDRPTMRQVFFTETGAPGAARLCVADFLVDHPERIPEFRQGGLSEDVIERAQRERLARANASARPAPAAPVAPAPAKPASEDEE